MSTVDWILLILIVFLSLTLLAFSIYYSFVPTPYTYLEPISGNLNTITSISDNRIKNFHTKGDASLSIFVFLEGVQRTPILKEFSRLNENQESQTERNNNYLNNFNIFSLGTGSSATFVFKQYSGSSIAGPTAEIRIRTVKPNTEPNKENIEVFPIKAIPIQNWINITVVRSGRRYTIYYNTDIVASFRTKYNAIVDRNFNLEIGDKKSYGYFAFPLAADIAFTQKEVHENLVRKADTRNKPILPKPSISNIFGSLKGCPDGIFCFKTSAVPSEGVNQWSSPFA